MKEGKCETEMVRLYMTHPNHQGENRVRFPYHTTHYNREKSRSR